MVCVRMSWPSFSKESPGNPHPPHLHLCLGCVLGLRPTALRSGSFGESDRDPQVRNQWMMRNYPNWESDSKLYGGHGNWGWTACYKPSLCLTGGLPEHPPARYKKTDSPFKDGSTFCFWLWKRNCFFLNFQVFTNGFSITSTVLLGQLFTNIEL